MVGEEGSMMRLLTLLLAALLLASCDTNPEDETEEPVVWGECGPPELEGPLPPEAYEALEKELELGGMIERNCFDCEDGLEVSFGTPTVWGGVRDEIAKSDEPTDDFLVLGPKYFITIKCDGVSRASAMFELEETGWDVGGCGGVSLGPTLEAQFEEQERPGCFRGSVMLDVSGRSCSVIVDKKKGVLFYPRGMDYGEWGDEYLDKVDGDFYFTKEEFLKWCRENL
jgi:hypothetical protein